MVAVSATMLDSSARANANISSVSVVIEQNAAAAAEVGLTTNHVNEALARITQASVG